VGELWGTRCIELKRVRSAQRSTKISYQAICHLCPSSLGIAPPPRHHISESIGKMSNSLRPEDISSRTGTSRIEDSKNEGGSRACVSWSLCDSQGTWLRLQNACRRMKIRCIDKDSPPCKRCRNMSLACSFDPAQIVSERDPRRYRNWLKDGAHCSRIDDLEGQMAGVNSKLDGIASLLATLTANIPGIQQPRYGMSWSRSNVG
jgi:hypothetical protein